MAAYCLVYGVIHFTSPAGWLPIHRDQLGAQRSVTSMGKLYLLFTQKQTGLLLALPVPVSDRWRRASTARLSFTATVPSVRVARAATVVWVSVPPVVRQSRVDSPLTSATPSAMCHPRRVPTATLLHWLWTARSTAGATVILTWNGTRSNSGFVFHCACFLCVLLMYVLILCFVLRPSCMKSRIVLCYNISKLTYLLTSVWRSATLRLIYLL